MKKRNPIYTAGSFLLAGALTLSMAACSGAGGHADAFRHSNTGCHSRACRGNDPFRAGIRRTPREGLAAQRRIFRAKTKQPMHDHLRSIGCNAILTQS